MGAKQQQQQPASYRPISLLPNPSKILERLVLNVINPSIPLSPTQHGFRSQHSTTTLLTNLTQTIHEGLNTKKPPKRTLIAAIDISKAFDTVPRHILINKILDTHIHPNFKKWLANFLSGRHGHTIYNSKPSTTRPFTNGVPQGSVLSPSLFNLFMHDIPSPTHPDVHISSYADDLTIISQHPKHETAATHMQQYITTLERWLLDNRMKVSADKSTLTLATSHTREHTAHPHVTLNNTPIPHNNTSTILGVTYDTGTTFRKHTENINTKAKNRMNVLRALANTTYGHSKESITTLYKQFIRPILTYAHPAWHTDLAQTHSNTLQRTQNMALRIATGCTKSTPIDHLHEETRVLPLAQHMNMTGVQFFAGTANPEHPCHRLQAPLQTRRSLHNTPASHYNTLLSNIPPKPDNISTRKHVHTTFTEQALTRYKHNSLLGSHPPPVAEEESSLPRVDRVHLSRLRCGHHPALLSYQHRIGLSPTDTCPRCLGAPDTVMHVMEQCPATARCRRAHRIRSVEDLWRLPAECIACLREAAII